MPEIWSEMVIFAQNDRFLKTWELMLLLSVSESRHPHTKNLDPTLGKVDPLHVGWEEEFVAAEAMDDVDCMRAQRGLFADLTHLADQNESFS